MIDHDGAAPPDGLGLLRSTGAALRGLTAFAGLGFGLCALGTGTGRSCGGCALGFGSGLWAFCAGVGETVSPSGLVVGVAAGGVGVWVAGWTGGGSGV